MIRAVLLCDVLLLTACGPRHDYPDNRGLEGQLEREVIALHQRVRQLESELLVCADGTNDPLYGQLHQLFAGTEVTVARVNAVTVLSLPSTYLFAAPFEFRLRDEAQSAVDLLATALRVNPDYDVWIMGHTSDRPIPPEHGDLYDDGLDVTMAMAETVARVLMTNFELDPARFGVAGRGPWAPLKSNDVESGQDTNERIEIHLFPRGSR